MTADLALRPLPEAPAAGEPAAAPGDLPQAQQGPQPVRPRLGRRALAAALAAAGLAGTLSTPAAAPVRDAVVRAGAEAVTAMTLQESDLAGLPADAPVAAAAVPPEVRAARERGRAAAEDGAAGLRRAAGLLDAGRPDEALQAFTLAVQALALVPADEPRRPGLAEQARQVRGRLVAALEPAAAGSPGAA